MRIVVIDSGISDDKKHKGIHISEDDNGFYIDDVICDAVGHGTAICSIIQNHNPNAEIFVVKIFDGEDDIVDENKLLFALEYVYLYLQCDILNLSLGITVCNNSSMLEVAIKKLENKGIVIISAFDNYGGVSYPAVFKNVIGVVSFEDITKVDQYCYINNDAVNIGGYGKLQRVLWKNMKFSMQEGNSYACAHISGIISLFQLKDWNRENILCEMEKNAQYKIMDWDKTEFNIKKPNFMFKKAILFPFNKEMHSLVRFQEMLAFEINDVYDVRYSLRVGASTNKLLKIDNQKDFIIKALEDIEWEGFELAIIGHINILIREEKIRSEIAIFIYNCIIRGKKIYAFDNLTNYFDIQISDDIFCVNCPINIKKSILPTGMLYSHDIPVLGVFGTSSQQGKYTLQLIIRKLLLKKGYKIGQLGTEPTAYLFGMEECFPFGYGNSIELNEYEMVAVINSMMHVISQQNPDLIIVGSQGGTITSNFCNLKDYKFSQNEFLLGTLPDAIILCINTFDEYDEINRTISYIESVCYAKVLGVVIFPQIVINNDGMHRLIDMNINNYTNYKEEFCKNLRRNVYILGDEWDMNSLLDNVLYFFGETELQNNPECSDPITFN